MHRPQHSRTYLSLVPSSSKTLESTNVAISKWFDLIGVGFSWGCTRNAWWCETHKPTILLLDVLRGGMIQVVLIPHRVLGE